MDDSIFGLLTFAFTMAIGLRISGMIKRAKARQIYADQDINRNGDVPA